MACFTKQDIGNCGCACTLKVQVKGCNSPAVAVGSGITVALKVGASTIDSQSTDSSGIATFTQAAGTYDVVVTDSRGTSRWNSQTFTSQSLTCGGTTNVSLTSMKSGFHCIPACGDPLADTLYDTDPNGTWTLTYDGSNSRGAGWYGCATKTSMTSVVTALAPGTCVKTTGTANTNYLIRLSSVSGALILYWGYVIAPPATTLSTTSCSGGNLDPDAGIDPTCILATGEALVSVSPSTACPPSVSITATSSSTGTSSTANPGSGSHTITE